MSVPREAAIFGDLLRAQRRAAGLTQDMLAKRSGVSARSIQKLEAGSVLPRRSTATFLADALGLSGTDREEFERAVPPAHRGPVSRLPKRTSSAPIRRDGLDTPALAVAHLLDHSSEPRLVALSRPTPTNIPWPISSLIGRERDVAAISALISEDGQRLVTLTGVGGSGKTRLAVQVAAELLGTPSASPSRAGISATTSSAGRCSRGRAPTSGQGFADGVWFVDLASTSSPALVPRDVAGALGVREVDATPIVDLLLAFLRRKRLLLVLDNCEHLIDACAVLARTLLTACPALHILATSREPLQIDGEQRRQVEPLTLPDVGSMPSLDALVGAASVRLFVARAQEIDASFSLTDSSAASVARICIRLDGIPLAIELAASRIRVLTVDQIAARLDDSFRILAGGPRGGPTRQQTMQAALDWSYDLLTDCERATFRILSTFAAGFDLEAAEAIAGFGCQVSGSGEHDGTRAFPNTQNPAPETLEVLSRLVDKSLVVAERVPAGHRYRLLEPVRQYAAQALLVAGEQEHVRARHAAYYTTVAERAAPLLRGAEQIAWLDRLDVERDNLRAALEWIVEHGDAEAGLRLVVAMTPFWEGRGYLSEARRWLEQALSWARLGLVSDETRLKALAAAGELAQWLGALQDAETLLVEGLTLARDLGHRQTEAELLGSLSAVYRRQNASDRALLLAEESLRLSTELDHIPGVAFALLNLGVALRHHGELVRSVPALEESARLYRELADVRWGAIALTLLGWAVFEVGDAERAGPLLLEGVNQLRAVGDQGFIVVGLKTLAGVACARGEPRRGAEWFAAAEALRISLGVHLSPRDEAIKASFLRAVRDVLTASELFEATVSGGALSLDQVVADVEQAWPSSAPQTAETRR